MSNWSFPYHSETDSAISMYNMLYLLTGVAVATLTLARLAKSHNRLNYESPFARIIAGLLRFMVQALHTNSNDLKIPTDGALIAVGPHNTALEAVVVAAKLKGTPPRFFATDAFNKIPGVARFMAMFQTIDIDAKPTKIDGQSSNSKALDRASEILNEGGCVTIFPQGGFSKLGEEPRRVYDGIARLALRNKTPIHVVRLDGFWSLQNPLIPVSVRNSTLYRVGLSALHMNNIRTTICRVIDFHLKPENENLPDEQKIEEICAQLYAYYRHTKDLTEQQIDAIREEIADGTHLDIWHNRVQQDSLGKQLRSLHTTNSLWHNKGNLLEQLEALKVEAEQLSAGTSMRMGMK